MITYPNIKINLGLSITGKRPDGYHNIDSVFYPLEVNDILEIIPDENEKNGNIIFSSSGLEITGNESENLCVKAYQLLHNKFNLPAIKMHLHKIIPMGAGLGGGSADGAFVIQMLDELFGLHLTEIEKMSFAAKLGSDCMFFILNKPSFVSGRGEIIQPVPLRLNRYKFLIVHPKIHVSTSDAYSMMEPRTPEKTSGQIVMKHSVTEWKNELTNDFEIPVFQKHPEIKEIKEAMYLNEAVYASMSGSGSAVFGIFEKEKSLQLLKEKWNKYSIFEV